MIGFCQLVKVCFMADTYDMENSMPVFQYILASLMLSAVKCLIVWVMSYFST